MYTLNDETKLSLSISTERAIAGLEQKQIQVGDHTIQYLDSGPQNSETILMIHGFGANKDNWIRLAKYFTQNYRVISPDLPGFGESTILKTASYDVESQTTRLKALIDQLGIKQIHITGNSMGGYIAAHFASNYPEITKSAWLLNPLGVESSEPSEMFKMFSQGLHPYVLPRNEKEFRLLLSKVFHELPYTPDFAIRALNQDFQRHYESNERIAFEIHKVKDGKIAFTYPIEESLKKYKNPLLVVWGDDDRILSADGLRVIKEQRPETETVMMKNMGHAPMIEDPEATAEIIKMFLERNKLTQ
ncbi:alpha/beta fold hydrolase [Litoribrevibacter albus]|uniref:Lipase n=1 Tax=Litoribrevibacter albus TaxID=1473156 RepID=A0AA37S916_9GAMM|nr:alpha/beta hydrolase [Litoribrevibacter albus]GLQ30756.1 lipase [Litoribrevibacter albus]